VDECRVKTLLDNVFRVRSDKAYGSGEFLAWLLERNIQPHIPVIDRRHQTRGHFTRDAFRYEPKENAYYCPEGKPLHYRGEKRSSQGHAYCSTEAQCQGCPQKKLCTTGPFRHLFVHWHEPARQIVRGLTATPAYKQRYLRLHSGRQHIRIPLRR
jgi:hypothetical protein